MTTCWKQTPLPTALGKRQRVSHILTARRVFPIHDPGLALGPSDHVSSKATGNNVPMKNSRQERQQRHAQKITHRQADGRFKSAPATTAPRVSEKKLQPAELDQDAGARYDSTERDFPQE